MTKKTHLKLTSFLLCLLMLLTAFTPAVAALDNIDATEESSAAEQTAPVEATDAWEAQALLPGEKTLAELQAMTVNVATLPEFISATTALEKQHVNRLTAQETNLNQVIYQNKDGGKTAYIFGKAVKYVDEAGKIQDKSTAVAPVLHTDYAYAMLQNSVKVYFPQAVAQGTLVHYQDYALLLAPETTVATAPQTVDGAVVYPNVFGANTLLRYQTRLDGVKEDIILVKNIGQNQFTFTMTLQGLTPVLENSVWYLKDAADEKIATLGQIYIEDSAGNTALGSMTVTATNQTGVYTVTVTAPQDFLNDPETEYPVYIDPSVTIYETEEYWYTDEDGRNVLGQRNTITDTYLGQNDMMTQMNLDDPSTHLIGTVTPGSGKIIYKLQDFYDENGIFTTLRDGQIASVSLHLTLQYGGINYSDTSTHQIHANPMTATWNIINSGENPIAITDTSLWNAYSTAYDSYVNVNALQSNVPFSIDITEIVKGWTKYNNGDSVNAYDNPQNGFVLQCTCDVPWYYILSTESNATNNNVYVSLDYGNNGGNYYLNNSMASKLMTRVLATTVSVEQYSASNAINQQWFFQYVGDNKYYIQTGPYEVLYSTGSDLSINSFPSTWTNAYYWTIEHADGGGVLIRNASDTTKVLAYNGTRVVLTQAVTPTSITYRQTVWGIMRTNMFVPLADTFTLNDDWLLPGTTKQFSIKRVPANASWASATNFTWSITADQSGHSFSVDQQGNITAGGGTATLTLTHKVTGTTATFRITSGLLREGVYTFKNAATQRYIHTNTTYPTTSGAMLQQYNYHTGDQEKWNLTICPNGTYSIRSVANNLFMSGTFDNVVTQSSSYATYGTWYVTQTNSGNYRFSPVGKENYAASVPANENNEGTYLSLDIYTNNTDYRDEWVLDYKDEVKSIQNGSVYRIKALHSGKVLTVQDGVTLDGTNVLQADAVNGYSWQRWKFIYLGNGEYKLEDANSGKLLSVASNSSEVQAQTQIRSEDGGSGQIFRIRQNVDGTYTFLTKSSNYNLVLDVDLAGNDLEQYDDNGTANQKFTLQESNKAIIIIPGFLGSELFVGSNNPYFNEGTALLDLENIHQLAIDGIDVTKTLLYACLLLPLQTISLTVNDIYTAIIDTLSCNNDGSSKYNIDVKEFRPNGSEEATNVGTANKYGDLYNTLRAAYQTNFAYEVEFFSYDWRLSNSLSAQKLNDYINKYDYSEVVLLGHSLGGLVASGYLGMGSTQRSKVEQVIYLSSPLLGVPDIANIWFNEDIGFLSEHIGKKGMKIYNVIQFFYNPIPTLIRNYVSVYEALPSQYYFQLTGSYYLLDKNIPCSSYGSTKILLQEILPGFNTSLMEKAEIFHNSIFDSNNNHVSTQVNSLYCYSGDKDTNWQMNFDDELTVTATADGDSLVPTTSATLNTQNTSDASIGIGGGHMAWVSKASAETIMGFILLANN